MERNTRRVIQGVVTSNKCDKTITVLVETYKKDAKYSKSCYSTSKRYISSNYES